MSKKIIGRPKSRKIDDSKRPASERGLPEGEKRYSTVYDKKQLEVIKDIVSELSKNPKFKKRGSVPGIQFKDLIKEALTDLIKKYSSKKNTGRLKTISEEHAVNTISATQENDVFGGGYSSNEEKLKQYLTTQRKKVSSID